MRFSTGSLAFIIGVITALGACEREPRAPAAEELPSAGGAVTPPASETTAAVPAPGDTAASRSELAGTTWRLVEIQSMDGQTYKPQGQSKYTIRFDKEGMAGLVVDCNQGSTTWKSTAPSELRFGESIVLTKMLCPRPSLDERFLRDLTYVRTYTMKDGHLYLSTMADGAIYEFEPDSSSR